MASSPSERPDDGEGFADAARLDATESALMGAKAGKRRRGKASIVERLERRIRMLRLIAYFNSVPCTFSSYLPPHIMLFGALRNSVRLNAVPRMVSCHRVPSIQGLSLPWGQWSTLRSLHTTPLRTLETYGRVRKLSSSLFRHLRTLHWSHPNFTQVKERQPLPILPPPSVGRWLVLSSVLVLGIIVVGGVTRLTESGLSITEWRPITGILPPLSNAEWMVEFDKYKATPEFKL